MEIRCAPPNCKSRWCAICLQTILRWDIVLELCWCCADAEFKFQGSICSMKTKCALQKKPPFTLLNLMRNWQNVSQSCCLVPITIIWSLSVLQALRCMQIQTSTSKSMCINWSWMEKCEQELHLSIFSYVCDNRQTTPLLWCIRAPNMWHAVFFEKFPFCSWTCICYIC